MFVYIYIYYVYYNIRTITCVYISAWPAALAAALRFPRS